MPSASPSAGLPTNPAATSALAPSVSALDPATSDAATVTSALLASMQTDAHAMALLHETNVAEIQAGTLAQQRAQGAAVRDFAATMVREHGALDQQGMALGQRLGLVGALPDSLLPRLLAHDMSRLTDGAPPAASPDSSTASAAPTGTPATGDAAFDQTYLAQQVAAHTRTLTLVDAAIQRAQSNELRTLLETQVRPRVAAHLEHAQRLQKDAGR